MKLFIRDDDTSYFTTPRELEEAYGDIWDKGPISIAIIPFDVHTEGRGDITIFKQNPTKEYPIGDNIALVDFIKQKMKERKLYIMLHGYNHLYDMSQPEKHPMGIPEFAYKKDPSYFLKKGKEYLEDLFHQEIKWFVPPSNTMNEEAIQGCAKLDLNIATSIGIRNREKTYTSVKNYVLIKYSKLRRVNRPLKYEKHYELAATSFTKVSDFSRIEEEYPMDNFIIATHYWEMNKYSFIKERVKKFVDTSEKIFSINEILDI